MVSWKRHGKVEADYRAQADKYTSEWVSSEVTGDEPTVWDQIQSAPPVAGWDKEDKK
jgi:hypothetical protein